uniref:Uncharacterized protein n=1 Tax=Anas platyrhynchos TaxID=8839 RepID=A0A8B9T7D6_ANAPL
RTGTVHRRSLGTSCDPNSAPGHCDVLTKVMVTYPRADFGPILHFVHHLHCYQDFPCAARKRNGRATGIVPGFVSSPNLTASQLSPLENERRIVEFLK